jgi:hypothetical protein
MKNPTVFVVKEQVVRSEVGAIPMDYSPAMQFGDLEFITSHDMPLYGRSGLMDGWNEDVARFVEKYDPFNDFIITTGQPAAIFAVGWALGRAGKTPRFLVWRREENRYRVVNFQ